MPTINATPGDPNANSYATMAQVQEYADSRIYVPLWEVMTNGKPTNQAGLVIMATRTLDALAQPFKTLFPAQGGAMAYYRVRRMWTGSVTLGSLQALAWPRNGMLDHNGNAIDPTIIPQALVNATAEFAIQLSMGDRTLDLQQVIQGITSLRASSVSLGFKPQIQPQVIPDAVYNLLPQSWLTDEDYLPAMPAEFDVVSRGSTPFGREYDSNGRGDDWWGS